MSIGLHRILNWPDIRPICFAGYPVSGRISGFVCRISGQKPFTWYILSSTPKYYSYTSKPVKVIERMSRCCFFVIPFNYSPGYSTGYPAKQIARISGQFSIRCNPSTQYTLTHELRRGHGREGLLLMTAFTDTFCFSIKDDSSLRIYLV